MNDNDLGWLWEASSALYPATYIDHPPYYSPPNRGSPIDINTTFAKNQLWVDDQVAEAVHVARSVKKSTRPAIFAYGRADWYSRADYRNASGSLQLPQDLHSTVARPAAWGADGVVLWGSSDDADDSYGGLACSVPNASQPPAPLHNCSVPDTCAQTPCMTCGMKCQAEAEYIGSTLGPTAEAAVRGALDCAREHCPEGGRCVTVDAQGVALQTPQCV